MRPSEVVVRRLAHTSGDDDVATEVDKEGADGTGCVRISWV